MRSLLTPLLLTLIGGVASAHEGHGFSGAHWHASDLFGPLLLAVVAGGLWWTRRK